MTTRRRCRARAWSSTTRSAGRTRSTPRARPPHRRVPGGDDHGVDEPQLERAIAAHHLRGECKLLRRVHADALAEEPRRAEVEARPALGEDGREAARSEHHVRSAASASPNPAPTHTPSTLAITGIGQSCTASTTSPSTRIASSWLPRAGLPPVPPLPLPPRSAPAQKSPPAPVNTTAAIPSRRCGGTWLRGRPTCRRCTRSSPPGGRG